MEHLPPVDNPYEPVFVPFIADQYDGLDFIGYPVRRGLDLDRLTKGDFQNLSSDQVASFLQTWLYFGLLHGILGINFPAENFIRVDESGKKWLTTEKLPKVLRGIRYLMNKEKEMPYYTDEYVKTHNDMLNKCFRHCHDVWEEFSRLNERFGIPNPMSPEVALGIQILAITLQVGATEICGGKPGEPTYRKLPWETGRHWRITRSKFMNERMVSQGWCPTVVKQIWSKQNPLGQYYASLLGPPRRKLDHSSCNFDDTDCEAMKKQPLSKGKHENEGCQCETLLVDVAKLCEIIEIYEVPILRLLEQNGRPFLDVVSCASQPGLEYTAMSHVWSDGWGNPDENSLPLCRVQKLVRDISATYSMPDFDVEPPQGKYYRSTKHDDRVFFWMDTLCVPRSPDHIHARAIMQMRDIYTNAERVLVYDAELMAATAEAGYEELNMRVACSRWIRRLWTVQEAVLAQRLIYQFAERPHMFMTGTILWKNRNRDLALNYYNSVGWDCTTLFEAYDMYVGRGLQGFIWTALLKNRSVTVKSDEAICGGILMNLDMKKLLAVPETDRMKTYWTLVGDMVPLATIFFSGRRLQAKGFQWAPASLLACTTVDTRKDHLCSLTPEGLRTKIAPYSAFEVDPPQQYTPACFPCVLQRRKYFIKKSPINTNPSWEGLDLHKRSNLVVILEMHTVQGDDGTWSTDGSRGALMSVISRKDGTFFAEYLRLVSIVQEGSAYHRFPNPPWTPAEIEGTARLPSEAKWIEVEQAWCFV